MSSDETEADGANRFRIIEPMGQGASSTVYRALDNLLGCEVALKILHSHLLDSPSTVERFRNEAILGQKLHHPHIVTTYGFVSLPDTWSSVAAASRESLALIQELVHGTNIREHAQSLNAAERRKLAERILLEIGAALEHAHRQGVLHRDVKPSNILLGTDRVLKLSDFGIARSLSEDLTHTQSVIGTLPYIAPELKRGASSSAASDFFSLGIVALDLVTGEGEGNDHAGRAPLPPLGVRLQSAPSHLQPVLSRLLSDVPAERPVSEQDVSALIRDGYRLHLFARMRRPLRSVSLAAACFSFMFLLLVGLSSLDQRIASVFGRSLFAIRSSTGVDLFPLAWATYTDRLSPVELLLYAAQSNDMPLTKWLIEERRQPPNQPSITAQLPVCAAIIAGADETASYLIENGREGFRELKCLSESSPLVEAVERKRTALVGPLLNASAPSDNEQMTKSGRSAYEVVMLSDDPEQRALMSCDRFRTYVSDIVRRQIFYAAVVRGDERSVEALLECSSLYNLAQEPELAAASASEALSSLPDKAAARIVEVLLRKGARLEATMFDVPKLVSEGEIETIKELYKGGILLGHYRDKRGAPLSSYAEHAKENQQQMLELVARMEAVAAGH